MSDTALPIDKPSLGVGRILGDAFSLVGRNFIPMMIVGIIPAGVGVAMNLALYGAVSQNPILAFTDPGQYLKSVGVVGPFVQFLTAFLGVLLWGFGTASMIEAAYSAANGRQVSVGRAISTGIRNIGGVCICMVISGIAIYIGLVLLILPGLYLCALWFVIIPAVVVEKSGFGAFERSKLLTREYRWQLVGLIFLYGLVLIVLMLVTAAAQYIAFLMGSVGLVFGTAFSVLYASFFYALSGALFALTYARLTEIKEGTSMQNLADVFS